MLKTKSFIPFGGGNTAKPLDQCMRERCESKKVMITCAKSVINDNFKDQCGTFSPADGAIILIRTTGSGNCYFEQGAGWAPVIFHEAIHSCGLADSEPYDKNGANPSQDFFKQITKVCTKSDEYENK